MTTGVKDVNRAPKMVKLGNHRGQSPGTVRKVMHKTNKDWNKRNKDGTATKTRQKGKQ